MKNKKMVATLASLCLIVVAVVAAVVGVLAAVTQNVHATFKVTYVAQNVYATVEMRSAGPTLSGTRTLNDFAAITGDNTHPTASFKPSDNSKTEEVEGIAYNYGWSDNAGDTNAELYGYSIYEFKFINKGSNAMTVQLSSTAAPSTAGLERFWYSATSPLTLDNATGSTKVYVVGNAPETNPSWGSDGSLEHISLTTKATAATESESAGLTPLTETSNQFSSAVTVPAHTSADGVMYIYLLVALGNVNTSLNSGSQQTCAITFTLRDATAGA